MSFYTQAFESALPSEFLPTILPGTLPPLQVIVIGPTPVNSGTSSAGPTQLWEPPYTCEPAATDSGLILQEEDDQLKNSEATRRAISELRRISGLTWEQLGELFSVSRRSVHFWASGKPLNVENEARLMSLLDVVRAVDQGDTHATRVALLEVRNGITAFALLAAGRFDDAREWLGKGIGRPRLALAELSASAKAARSAMPPGELIEAQYERVHHDPGHARAARTIRNTRRGNT